MMGDVELSDRVRKPTTFVMHVGVETDEAWMMVIDRLDDQHVS